MPGNPQPSAVWVLGSRQRQGPNSWWPLSSEAPLYTPLGPCKGLWFPSHREPANCTSWLASCPCGMGTVPRFTISLDHFQPVPVGRHSILLPSESLETQRGTLFLDLGRRKRWREMVTVSLNICPASLLIIITLMLIYCFGLAVATTYYSIYWKKSTFLTGTPEKSREDARGATWRLKGCGQGPPERE